MQQLMSVIERAKLDLTSPAATVAGASAEAEVARVLNICNACRYCEGFCAVFPAMARRLVFDRADVHYLANLCHNCGACFHACQYAPPHEFRVNVPRAMAVVRGRTYREYAWPQRCASLYERNGLVVALALALGIGGFLMLASARMTERPLDANFYAVFPHGLMVAVFGAAFAWAVLALAIGVRRFWRDAGVTVRNAPPAAVREAIGDGLSLRYLGGGHGEGCNEADDRFTLWRRRFHHMTFYGFALCFAATCVATIYHYGFGQPAPYPLLSAPVLLGTVGGIGLLIGPAGLAWLHARRDPRQSDPDQRGMDIAFLVLLFMTSLTGLALLALRETYWMAELLAIHLGFVMAFFVTLPYGKFAHGVYRCAALLKWALEKRKPVGIRLGAD